MDSSRTRSVLVVNEDGEHEKFLSVLLEQSGCATTTAIDGVDGLEKARQHVPDVVDLAC
jgi:CheY-like chemotaxis protein